MECEHLRNQTKTIQNVYSTRYSQAVTHPSTNRARRCLTSVIGREPVLSTWYGRRHVARQTFARYSEQNLCSFVLRCVFAKKIFLNVFIILDSASDSKLTNDITSNMKSTNFAVRHQRSWRVKQFQRRVLFRKLLQHWKRQKIRADGACDDSCNQHPLLEG